ncbi:MAG: hypothetical protein V4648_05530 [Bacteroidota bacterium]
MKKIVILLYILCFVTFSQAQVGINTTTPSTNAVLDLNSHLGGSNYGGFMPPRITVAQRDAMPVTAADDGLIVYVTLADGSRCLQLYDGMTSTWVDITCTSIPVSTPVIAFVETMGTVITDTDVNTHQTNGGFDNSATCTISSSTTPQSQIRNSQVSTANFPTASGLGNLYFSSNSTKTFLIQNINVSAYTGPLTLQLLIYKSTLASFGSELTIEYYDGTSWINVSVSDLPTGSGTAIWHDRTLATNLPNTISQIRISTTGTNPIFRIDDIKIIEP